MATVVVIDDETEVRDIIANILAIGGHQPVLADAGPALLRELARLSFDLVVTDIRMPVIDGWQVAEWVRQHRPKVPVIALSGVAEILREYERNLVFNVLIAKPVRKAELLREVDRVLGTVVIEGGAPPRRPSGTLAC